MAQEYIHNKILDFIKTLPNFPNLKILDLSCGDAELASELANYGCSVTGTRFIAEDYIIEGKIVNPQVNIVNQVDLTKTLPFSPAEFDVVILQEVLEHLPIHSPVISEVSRVIKDEGVFIFSTPNIHRLHSRLHFFLTGAHKLKRRRIGWEVKKDQMYAYHFNVIDFPVFHTVLFQHGFKISKLTFSQVKLINILLLVFYPLYYLFVSSEFKFRCKRASRSRECEHDLRKHMLSPEILVSEQILAVCKKYTS